jgi:hypothetical protein
MSTGRVPCRAGDLWRHEGSASLNNWGRARNGRSSGERSLRRRNIPKLDGAMEV